MDDLPHFCVQRLLVKYPNPPLPPPDLSVHPSCLPYADEDCAIQWKGTRLKFDTLRPEFIISV